VILEGLVTTLNADGSVNIAPMGPIVDEGPRHLILRPYQTSHTYTNLKRTGQGVFHVTDDVEMLAQAAVGEVDPLPRLVPATVADQPFDGRIIADACRWYAFQVTRLDDRQERTHIEAEVIAGGALREFFGFNRGKHAVLEAAILATRTAFLPADEIRAELGRLKPLVDKTGGPAEHRAWEHLARFVDKALTAASADQA
jgi:hypothetical protein